MEVGIPRGLPGGEGEDAAALAELGRALVSQSRYGEAEDALRRALLDRPWDLPARLALVECLLARGALGQALNQLERARHEGPHDPMVLRRLVDLRTLCHDGAGALEVLEAWLAAEPGRADLQWERGTIHLMEGRFTEGWEDLEARFRVTDRVVSMMGPFLQPRWNGEPFPGRTLLLHWEQGLGDTLMFIRYAGRAKALGGRVIAVVQPTLVDVVATCPGIDEVIPDEAPLPPFDLHLPLMSLPRVFGTDPASIPGEVPYLDVPARVPNRATLKRLLSVPTDRVRIGYAWAGSAHHVNNRFRSLSPGDLAPLADLPGVAWHCFQIPVPEELPLPSPSLGPLLTTFSDTAYALGHMDLVLTVDTALAHLAGAMGLPTFLMLSHAAEWRWQWDRQDSPWYPTMRIYRQPTPGDWGGVIQQLAADLVGGS